MRLIEFVFFGTVLLVMKTCDGFIDELLDEVYTINKDAYKIKVSDDFILKERNYVFVTKMVGELSNLMPKEVKIPKFKQLTGSNWCLCTSETTVFLQLKGITSSIDLKVESDLVSYIKASFEVEGTFNKPVTFKIYKDDNLLSLFCKDSSFVTDATYTFNGRNQVNVKFSLIVPNFSKDRVDLPEKCIVYIDDIAIVRLTEPTLLNKVEDRSVLEIQNKFWSSVKDGDIKEMLRFGFKEALFKSYAGESEHTWFRLSYHFLKSFHQDFRDHLFDKKDDLNKDIDGHIIYQKSYTLGIEPSFQLAIENSVTTLQSQSNTGSMKHGTKCSESVSKVMSEIKTEKFTFISYYPFTFKCLRERFGIEKTFLDMFCHDNLITLSNPGKSRSGLYLSQNKMFIAKTLKKPELTTLQKLFPKYVLHLEKYSSTLLPKLVGLYSYINGIRNYLVAMNNLMPDNKKIGQKYDLKGSMFKRYSSDKEKDKKDPTFKDEDFIRHHPDGIYLKANDYEILMKTIKRDSSVLKEFEIMDYSLLLGLHYIDYPELTKEDLDTPTAEATSFPCESIDDTGSSSSSTDFVESSGKVTFQPTGIPAMTVNGKKLILYAGIIDILQEYNGNKWLETLALRYVVVRDNSFSAVEPDVYAKRFKTFMRDRVFKKMKECPKGKTKISIKKTLNQWIGKERGQPKED